MLADSFNLTVLSYVMWSYNFVIKIYVLKMFMSPFMSLQNYVFVKSVTVLYKTLIRPETWVLSKQDEHRLSIFEREILRRIYWYIDIQDVPGGMCQTGRVFLMLKYTDIIQNIYVQSWTVTEIKAREKCGLFAIPRTVPGSRDVIPIRCALFIVVYSWLKHVPRCDCTCKVLGNPKDNYDVSASVFVVQFNGFMSLTSYFDVKYRY